MLIITRYGTGGGTGRLSSATAFAPGLLQIGKCIDIVDATQGEPWV